MTQPPAAKTEATRRERFLAEMERVVPWAALLEALTPHYFPGAAGRRGRPPIGLERMLRMYFVQQWYALADEATEDAHYDSRALCAFVGIDLARESVPDATTLLKLRRWLEDKGLTETTLDTVNAGLREGGLLSSKGTARTTTARKRRVSASLPGNGRRVGLGHRTALDGASALAGVGFRGDREEAPDRPEGGHGADAAAIFPVSPGVQAPDIAAAHALPVGFRRSEVGGRSLAPQKKKGWADPGVSPQKL